MLKVYDNGGATFDRFTVVTNAGDIYTMSNNAMSPSGFNQYSHTLEKGEEYVVKNNEYAVPISKVPPVVLKAIIQRLEAE